MTVEKTETPKRGIKDTGEPYNIMIVDDSMFIRKQMTSILQSEGFQIAQMANDGLEAVEKYEQNSSQIDLITLDITMPNMDGMVALQKLIEFDPKVLVIMVSALGKEDLVKKSLLIGAKHYVVKPLTCEKVIPRIVSILESQA